MMTHYGYARPAGSALTPDLKKQIKMLQAAGCQEQDIYFEKNYATQRQERLELAKVLAKLGQGDVLVCASLPCVAISMEHLMDIAATVQAAGAAIRILDIKVDSRTQKGRKAFQLFSAAAHCEHANSLEQQGAHNASHHQQKVDQEHASAVDKTVEVIDLHNQGVSDQEIATATGMGVDSVYIVLGDAYPT